MKKKTNPTIALLLCLCLFNFLNAQNIIDDCITSVTPLVSGEFISSPDIANVKSSDVLDWDGSNWFGGFSTANITIPPPTNQIGCRVVFLGSGTVWTTGGEAIGLRLDSPLVSGNTYTFSITYVSHGLGSDGNFQPSFYTNATPSLSGASLSGVLPPAGNNWTTTDFSFVASAAQDGDTWVILRTEPDGSSGLINSFCANCNVSTSNCSVSINSETICEGDSATLIASTTTTGNYTYQWSVPSGVPDPGNVNSFSTDVGGDYSVLITDLDTNCNASASGTITVNPIPDAIVNSDIICEGSSTTVSATLSTTGNYAYQWSVPAGVPDPGNVSTFSTDIPGTYTAVITNTDTNCSSNASGTITVNPIPVANVNSESICAGTFGTITATANTTGNYAYQWSVPNGASNPGNVSAFSTDVPGTYTVVITDIDANCSSNSATGTLDILPDFEFAIEQYCDNDDFILEIVPVDNTFNISDSDVVWLLDNATVIGNDNTLNLNAYVNSTQVMEVFPLNINVNVTNSNGCIKTSNVSIAQTFCGIPQGISPNEDGMNDVFDLSALGVKKIQIYNRYGTEVYQKSNYTNEWNGRSNNGDDLPTGTYFYVIEFESNSDPRSGWVYVVR